MAYALAVVLIERVLRLAARASAPTWSTPGSPSRKRRRVASEDGDVAAQGPCRERGSAHRASIGWSACRANPANPPRRASSASCRRAAGSPGSSALRDGGGCRRPVGARTRTASPPPWPPAALLGGVLVWASLLRPRVSASRETLYLRNMLETIHIPLAAVDELVVRQVLTRAGGGEEVRQPRCRPQAPQGHARPTARADPGPAHVPDDMEDALGPVVRARARPPPTSTTRTTWRTGCATWSRRPGSGTASAGTPTRPRRWPATYAARRRGPRSRRSVLSAGLLVLALVAAEPARARARRRCRA